MGWLQDKFATLADPSDVPMAMPVNDTLGKSKKHHKLPEYSVPERVVFVIEILENVLMKVSAAYKKKTGRQLDLASVDLNKLIDLEKKLGNWLSGEAQANWLFLTAMLKMLDAGVTPAGFRQRFAFLLYAVELQLKEEIDSYEMDSARVFVDEELETRGLLGIFIPGLEDGEPALVEKDTVFVRYAMFDISDHDPRKAKQLFKYVS